MTPGKVEAGPVAGTDLWNPVLANCSEDSLDALRAQYLAEVFSLPASTAAMVAELAFGSEDAR